MKLSLSAKWLVLFGRLVVVLLSLAFLVFTVAWLSGMFESKVEPGWSLRAARKLTTQPTDQVHEVFKPHVDEAMGTLKASSRTIVSSKVLATIQSVAVSAGDQVQVGDELVILDSAEFETRLKQARQGQEAAQARWERALADWKRLETLRKQNAVSISEYDAALGEKKIAEAEVARSKQAVQEAAIQLSYTRILAAKPGRIVDRLAEPGDMAQPGAPLLVLYDANSLRLEAPVSESLAVKLQVGGDVAVVIDATGQSFETTIEEIVPQADAPTRSFLVKASLPESSGLFEGMFGRLRVQTGERRHLCLATDALIEMGQLDFVDVVQPDGTLERRLVKLGQLGLPGRREVLSGLSAGDTVVLQNQQPLPPLDLERDREPATLPSQPELGDE